MSKFERCGIEVVPKIEIPQDLKRVITDFMNSSKVFLVLYGPPGTYKTTAAKKLVLAKLKKKKGIDPYFAYYIKFYSLVDLFEKNEEIEIEDIMVKTELLVVDDLISVNLRESFWLKLFSIVDERYEKQRKTVITTNHDLRKYLTGEVSLFQRIASRLCDENVGILYETQKGGSFRSSGDSAW